MNEKAEQLLARLRASKDKGMKNMWYMVFATEVLELLRAGETITSESLRAVLVAKVDAADAGSFWGEAYQAAVDMLDEATARGDGG